MPPRKKQRQMSDDHKAALAVGRNHGRSVRLYLEALEANKPKRGRKRTPESIAARLQVIEEALPTAGPLAKLQMTQEKFNLEAELAAPSGAVVDMAALEAAFVEAAAPYAASKKLSYEAFRAVGVTPAVLAKAGIKRGG